MRALKVIGEVLTFIAMEVVPFAYLVRDTINNLKKKNDENGEQSDNRK